MILVKRGKEIIQGVSDCFMLTLEMQTPFGEEPHQAMIVNHIKKELILMSKNEIFLDRVSLMGTMQFYLDYFVLSLALMSIFGKTFT